MPGTLIPSVSAMLSASVESLSCVSNPETANGPKNNRLRQQNQPTAPRSRCTSRIDAPYPYIPDLLVLRCIVVTGRREGRPWDYGLLTL